MPPPRRSLARPTREAFMNDPSAPAHDPRLLSLLEQHQSLRRQGRPLTAAELCPGDPDLAAALQRLVDADERLGALAAAGHGVPTLPPGAADETLAPKRPDTHTDAVPATDRYEVISQLGVGGMGAVYRARDRV